MHSERLRSRECVGDITRNIGKDHSLALSLEGIGDAFHVRDKGGQIVYS
jgi:hypothetical protein